MSINEYLNDTRNRAKGELTTSVEIVQAIAFPKPSSLALEKPIWKRIDDVVVVAADLKGSTKISYAKQDRVGARVYQAATGNCARILDHFDAAFIDIQGDGVFGIFHGERPRERAIAAAYTIKSFSSAGLGPLLAEQFGIDAPALADTGLKVGVADGTLLAKRIGVRGDHNEPVWAGKPVNYATKCAQAADRHGIVITDRVFERLEDNDYVIYSCGCVGGQEPELIAPLWSNTSVPTLGGDSSCKVFPQATAWCEKHGDDFCSHIVAGDKHRDDVPDTLATVKTDDTEKEPGEMQDAA